MRSMCQTLFLFFVFFQLKEALLDFLGENSGLVFNFLSKAMTIFYVQGRHVGK